VEQKKSQRMARIAIDEKWCKVKKSVPRRAKTFSLLPLRAET
jgi:hypothetical protein